MKLIKSFLAAFIGSVVANLIILYAIGMHVIDPAMPLHALSVGPITILTLFGTIGATIVYAVMRASMKTPNRAFIGVSVIVLVLSFIPDYLVIGVTSGPFAGGTLGAALTLALMHVISAIIIVLSLTKLWGPKVSATASL
jgi:hypothetical protein